MNRWKSAARKKLSRGESQKRENQKRKESKKEIIRNEKIKMREKLGKSIKKTKRSGQFWNLCCLKSTWRCGAKHLSK